MSTDRHIYGEVNSKTGMKRIFTDIRHDVEKARSRPDQTELYKRAGYLITLTHAPSWEEKFGGDGAGLRRVGKEEFSKTARKIRRAARKVSACLATCSLQRPQSHGGRHGLDRSRPCGLRPQQRR